MKVHILTVGDEILIGQTVDTNSAWMSQQLNLIGAEVIQITSVADEREAIKKGLDHALEGVEVVLMTGGLGPTKDDITKKVLAEYFGVDLKFSEETYARIQKIFETIGKPVTENHRIQCMIPSNAELLHNRMGTAPGMWFEWKGKVIISMPGVPFEMQSIMENESIPRLKARFASSPIEHRTLLTAGAGETQLAELLKDFENQLPEHIKLAYLPSLGQVKLRLTGRDKDASKLGQDLDLLKKEMFELVQMHVYGEENDSLAALIGRLCKEKGITICTAESCTGGRIGHEITAIPGSSEYYTGGMVAYSYSIKEKLLHVNPDTLANHGAVSEETVREMVKGALIAFDADIAVAVSGIAGPGGGTEEKPVGTVWLAVGDRYETRAEKIRFGKDRIKNIEYSTNYALYMLKNFIKNMD
jgi:nicotinamide-nucleotide amidase